MFFPIAVPKMYQTVTSKPIIYKNKFTTKSNGKKPDQL